MCGICGEVRFDGEVASVSAVDRMAQVLAPRGPDEAGAWTDGRLAVAHRRLKVIDPGPRACQPMVATELGLGLVYNGAIYNFCALRHELEALGYRFRSDGDTEVVLKAYHAWGDAFVERLDGMFAFALWETASGRLVLARDRLGIKPLYMAAMTGGLRFASSVPALLAAGGVDTALDPVAVQCYLTLGGAVPAPRTLLAGVRKLPPATVSTIEADGTRQSTRFWQLDRVSPVSEEIDEADLRDELLAILRRAVQRRLIADVPVGAFLSGGLDSSLVVGLMAEATTRPVPTYSIGFERVGRLIGHEFPQSDRVARRFGTEHQSLSVGPVELVRNLEGCVRAMSEPQTGRDAIGFYLLARQAAEVVGVVQSGQGADELFGGYVWHGAMRTLAGASTEELTAAYRRAAFGRDDATAHDALHPSLIGDDHSGHLLAELFDPTHEPKDAGPIAGPLARVLRYETEAQLCEDPLQRLDNMTMASGLEARVPFLDHEVVEFAARLPDRLKASGSGKVLLRQAARSLLPSEIVDRPKVYFPVPQLGAIRGSVLAFVRDVLTQPSAARRQLFRPGYLEDLLAAPRSRRKSRRLWEATTLECWLQVHGI